MGWGCSLYGFISGMSRGIAIASPNLSSNLTVSLFYLTCSRIGCFGYQYLTFFSHVYWE